MEKSPYEVLAKRLDEIPNGYPPTENGVEIRILEKLFTVEEAKLVSRLRLTPEKVQEIAERLDLAVREVTSVLKGLAKKGLINIEVERGRLAFSLMPFVVGFYERLFNSIDTELAALIEDYFQQTFRESFKDKITVHRVIPVDETVRNDMAVYPFESATEILNSGASWGVVDCICRKQKSLIGEGCEHPLDVCMLIQSNQNAFENVPGVKVLTIEEAKTTLKRAADAGLVHSVSNNQKGLWYICNCCTCSCGILQRMADLGVANVVARSAFINQVDEDLCIACGECESRCQFGAIEIDDFAVIDNVRCTGCGVCISACPIDAMVLVRRPDEEVLSIPETEMDWMEERAQNRGIDIKNVL
ncbi:MAG: 4Fe-4S binding protein [Anaerolineaceae bacterium]|nr:4Fe-4S binding protein [Anaerolineaceae bacterium]